MTTIIQRIFGVPGDSESLVDLGMDMIEWLKEHKIYGTFKVHSTSSPKYEISLQPGSYKVVTKFRRAFKIKRMSKDEFSESALSYNATIKAGDGTVLRVHAYAVSELPPSCKVVEEEVWIEKKLVLEHVEEGHFEKHSKVVCGKDEEEEE